MLYFSDVLCMERYSVSVSQYMYDYDETMLCLHGGQGIVGEISYLIIIFYYYII